MPLVFGMRAIDFRTRLREHQIPVHNRRSVMFSGRTLFRAVALVTLGILALAAPAVAQLTTGSLTGTLRDSQGGVVPGAIVTATSEAKGTQMPDVFTGASG